MRFMTWVLIRQNLSTTPTTRRRSHRRCSTGRADRGILICGSGAGAAVAANKLQGIRASVAHDTYTAHQMVEHDDVNIISLGSRVIGEALAEELVTTFLEARFSREDRHVRRLEKIRSLEA